MSCCQLHSTGHTHMPHLVLGMAAAVHYSRKGLQHLCKQLLVNYRTYDLQNLERICGLFGFDVVWLRCQQWLQHQLLDDGQVGEQSSTKAGC